MVVDTSRWYNVNFEGMVDIVDIVDNMVLVNNVNMVDSRGMVNMKKTFGYLKLPVDTSGWTRRTW